MGCLSLDRGWRARATGVYFGMIGWIKTSLFPAPPGADKITKRGYDFNAGLISGTLATLANTPFDVVSRSSQSSPEYNRAIGLPAIDLEAAALSLSRCMVKSNWRTARRWRLGKYE